jgi:hypothetical protein
MIMRNHGLLTCGATIQQAFNTMYQLECPADRRSTPWRRAKPSTNPYAIGISSPSASATTRQPPTRIMLAVTTKSD